MKDITSIIERYCSAVSSSTPRHRIINMREALNGELSRKGASSEVRRQADDRFLWFAARCKGVDMGPMPAMPGSSSEWSEPSWWPDDDDDEEEEVPDETRTEAGAVAGDIHRMTGSNPRTMDRDPYLGGGLM